MVNIIKVGETGITRNIEKIINYIEENPKEFLAVARVDDGRENYSFIALFKDRCTVGKYSALLHEWGTNDGMSGEGERGFFKMNEFLSKNNHKLLDMELTSKDASKIGYMEVYPFRHWEERLPIWKKYVQKLIDFSIK